MSKLKFMNIEVDNLTMSEAINAMDLLIQNKENLFQKEFLLYQHQLVRRDWIVLQIIM